MKSVKETLVMCLLIGGLFAGWSTEQKVLWGTYTAVWAVDFGQTRYIANHPDKYFEKVSEFVIGEHPSAGVVHNYFAFSYLANYLIADVLGDRWRSGYLGAVSAVHLYCIIENEAIGIKVDFDF